jgi:hypothetical protein
MIRVQPERQGIMDETKQRGTFSSSDLATAATEERQAEAKEIAESLTGRGAAESPKPSRYSPVMVSPEAGARESSPAGELVGFLKQTKRVWIIAAGGIFGLVVVATLLGRGYEWASYVRQRRDERAVASVTPDRLIARCGQPSADDTKEVFPILMRTMTYQVGRHETYVFSFSRTAEDKSDWVFLSMKDTSSGKSYDTPEEKVAAMSCLDSRK